MLSLRSTGLHAVTGLAAALAAALAISLPASAQEAAGAPANALKIGVIGPFTGGSADFGVPMLNGIMQAVDEINAAGGYLGRQSP